MATLAIKKNIRTPGEWHALERVASAELARRSFLDFVLALKPDYLTGEHHRALASALERVAEGSCRRLMVFMPPRHGKSTLVSQLFPCWYLGQFPQREIVVASYALETALEQSGYARGFIASNAYSDIFPGVVSQNRVQNQSLGEWKTRRAGRYYAVGVGGALTGKGADLAIIDDPVKNRAEANSPTVRKTALMWYRSTLYTRLSPDGVIVLVMTRWHPEDLAGTLLKEAQAGGEPWEVINMPALDTESRPLWPARFDVAKLAEIRQAIGSSEFASLYQQMPIAVEDMTYWPPERWAHYSGDPTDIPGFADAPVFGFLDPAGGKGKGDFVSLCAVATGSDGKDYAMAVKMSQTLKPTETVDTIFQWHSWIAGLPGRVGRGFRRFGIESNGMQGIYLDLAQKVAQEVRARGGDWQVPLEPVPHCVNKETRIQAIQAPIENGWLVIPEDAERRWPELWAQFAGYGPESKPSHDDGPDCLAACVEMAKAGRGTGAVSVEKPRAFAGAGAGRGDYRAGF